MFNSMNKKVIGQLEKSGTRVLTSINDNIMLMNENFQEVSNEFKEFKKELALMRLELESLKGVSDEK